MQPEIYHQNYQSFYPSEPFTLDHINMRHPVGQLKLDYLDFLLSSMINLGTLEY